MPGSKKKKAEKPANKSADDVLDHVRRGMPAKDSILRVEDFVSAQNVHYKILKTTETDAYDPVPKHKKDSGSKS